MERDQLSCKHLAYFEEVTEISKRICSGNHGRIERACIDPFFLESVFFIGHLDVSAGCIRDPMSPKACWKHAIEHIDSAIDTLYEILGSSEPHKIVWLGRWQVRSDSVKDADHILLRLTDRESPNSHSWGWEISYEFHGFDS